MKTLYPSQISRRCQGVALVIVLSVLVLMSALLVAFMGTVSTERLSQRAAYSTFEAQQAAESAVNLVISQIRAATTETDDGTQAWASQPGAIRTFGTASKVYKLYSSNRMQVSEGDYRPDAPTESGIDPADPQTAPDGGFVDLNQPILVPAKDGKVDPHYPIVDPRAAMHPRNGRPAELGKGRVEGFWVPQNLKHPSGVQDSANVDVVEVPMRVRWLYHLRDGTVVAPDPVSKRLPNASKENPPVARVAFWTDDESSKLNVNTAGEHTYWDTPMVSAYHESGEAPNPNATPTNVLYPTESAALAAAQPTAGEYQRFPGHPATTNLSPALRWLFPRPEDPTEMLPRIGTTKNSEEDFKQALYRLTPRLQDAFGSSMSGMRANYDLTIDYRVSKRDRLFANLDEFWFRPDRSPISGPSYFGAFRQTSMTPQPDWTFVEKSVATPASLEQLRFFLTASSRASDLNMFGLPRVCNWPIHELDDPAPTKSKRSGFDDLIAFCSTIAEKPYYFTRARPWDPVYDYEVSGTKPSDVLRAFPGRNKELLLGDDKKKDGYLRRMVSKTIPGVGGSFEAKYGTPAPGDASYTEIDRILITMFDYIRSTNLIDTGRKTAESPNVAGYPLAYTPGYSPVKPPKYGDNDASVLGSGQVIPTVIYGANQTPVLKGFGRFVNLAEVGLLFYRDNSKLPGTSDPDLPTLGAGEERVSFRCVLLPEMMTVSPYFPGNSEGYAYKVKETTPFTVTNSLDPAAQPVKLNLADDDLNFIDVNPLTVRYGRFWMPPRGFANHFWTEVDGISPRKAKNFVKPNKTNDPAAYRNYPFYSRRIDFIKKSNEPEREFKLSAGTLEFEFYSLQVSEAQTANPPRGMASPKASTGSPLQRVVVSFPSVTLKCPRTPSPNSPTAFQTRILSQPGDSGRSWIDSANDVIRSMEANGAARGDHRFIAGLGVVTENMWAPSGGAPGDYADKSQMRVHNFRVSHGDPWAESKYRPISPNGTLRPSKAPKTAGYNAVAISIDGTVAGDYDRGISKHTDGAFINKPDEGNTRFDLGDQDVPGGGYLPYFRGANGYEEVGLQFFSPNRILPSAVMFGSLPSGVFAGRPWETLLFAPPTSSGHKGALSPPDHYLLDLFHMPVVEPYAISEPLSTMGKINLNSRIAPFGYVKMKDPIGGKTRSYIQRHTGLYGIFKNMRTLAIGAGPTGFSEAGHREGPLNDRNSKTRFEVDPQSMMDDIIDPALDQRKYFKSATEVCELDMPLKATFKEEPGKALKFKPKYNDLPGRRAFWAAHDMTGDNCRERAYAHVYPRLTTKSNVYTVHVWAQSLAKNQTSKDWEIFDEDTDRVLGEYRGSTTIERYIDVDEDVLEHYDAVKHPESKSLDRYYRFRIVNHKRFIVQ